MSPNPLSPTRTMRAVWCLGLSALAAVLAGCATPLDPRRDAELQSHAPVQARPTVRPVRAI